MVFGKILNLITHLLICICFYRFYNLYFGFSFTLKFVMLSVPYLFSSSYDPLD